MIELYFCLVLAHLTADFVLQTERTCEDKKERHWKSLHHYVHALIVFGLSWLISMDVSFLWGALIISVAHLCIDMWKSYREDNVKWFALDQVLHLLVIAGVAYGWTICHDWSFPFGIELCHVTAAIALLVCWKPANIFIKLILKYYSVNMPAEKESGFNAGALIGTIERWLILLFVCLGRYDALGLLIAAKSIIRFSEKDTAKTEYVLAGTLLSIFIAVLAGMLVIRVK